MPSATRSRAVPLASGSHCRPVALIASLRWQGRICEAESVGLSARRGVILAIPGAKAVQPSPWPRTDFRFHYQRFTDLLVSIMRSGQTSYASTPVRRTRCQDLLLCPPASRPHPQTVVPPLSTLSACIIQPFPLLSRAPPREDMHVCVVIYSSPKSATRLLPRKFLHFALHIYLTYLKQIIDRPVKQHEHCTHHHRPQGLCRLLVPPLLCAVGGHDWQIQRYVLA